ncbi:MAG: iron export ABC transporter permease subunit FetB [Desulfobacteraceae bacterium]|nr:iron export ABC transporter permease subunit FetB [Desulfobacteraceae bacterium]
MTLVLLTPLDLGLAAGLVLILVVISRGMHFGLERQLIIAAVRTTVQLLLVGLVLKALFSNVHWGWMTLVACVMLLAAGREISGRQKRYLKGGWAFGLGTLSMFVSSFAVTILTLTVIISPTPWFEPQYAIPLLGMLLGNTMNGISVGMDRLTTAAWDQRTVIEQRLMLGEPWHKAIESMRTESVRAGLIPIINSMMAAGLVSLPGMMTGQILGGNPPMEAVKYQIMIMFLIAGGTGLGTVSAVWLAARRLFDERQRLRLDRLQKR